MSITIPATYMGTPDAQLEVEPDEYGDSYTMTLRAADGHVIASASGFRPGAAQDFGEDHAANTGWHVRRLPGRRAGGPGVRGRVGVHRRGRLRLDGRARADGGRLQRDWRPAVIIKRTLTRDMPDRDRIVAHLELRIADQGETLVGGLSPAFSATCETYEARSNASGAARQKMGREPDGGGADHKAILRAFPQLDRFVELHGSDPDGTPMHALENGWYWYSSYDGKGTHGVRGSTDYEVACRTLRVSAIPAEVPKRRDAEGNIPAEFVAFVDAQRERWASEAREARKLLESLPND